MQELRETGGPGENLRKPGYLPWKGVTGMSGGKDPLFTLLQPLHKTPFSAFSVPQNPILTKITKFPNVLFKMPEFGKFSVLSLKIIGQQNLVQEASFGGREDNVIFDSLHFKKHYNRNWKNKHANAVAWSYLWFLCTMFQVLHTQGFVTLNIYGIWPDPHGHSGICHRGKRRISRSLYPVADKSQWRPS